ncbi:MAG: flagellar basal body L-ring protein FlgH [Gammaproteobacteria bacterium]|nr:flagellar basal body L-ring protein FlgH [Gammaproteobacteria bacterium]
MKRLLVFPVILLSAACSLNPPPKPDPEYAPVRPVVAEPPPTEDGGLYQGGYGMSLYADMSSKRVGDLITVILQESTNASKSVSTKTAKSSNIDLPGPSIMGKPVTYNGTELFSASVGQSRDFNGTGDASQSNSLSGRLTVVVTEVLPNGNLLVRGEKRLQLNQGSEFVKLSGLVRPADIRPDNSILSSSVANASIIYSGEGSLADAGSPGLFSRLVSSAWWPF